MTDERKITAADLARAEHIIGLEFTPGERKLMLVAVTDQRANYAAVRAHPIEHARHPQRDEPGDAPCPRTAFALPSHQ